MAELKFDKSVGWNAIEKSFPGAKELIEEVYLVLKLMGSSPVVKTGHKGGHKRTKNKSIYHKYNLNADNKKQLTIYIYKYDKFSHKIRFYNGSPEGMIVYIDDIDDLKSYLFDWLVDY